MFIGTDLQPFQSRPKRPCRLRYKAHTVSHQDTSGNFRRSRREGTRHGENQLSFDCRPTPIPKHNLYATTPSRAWLPGSRTASRRHNHTSRRPPSGTTNGVSRSMMTMYPLPGERAYRRHAGSSGVHVHPVLEVRNDAGRKPHDADTVLLPELRLRGQRGLQGGHQIISGTARTQTFCRRSQELHSCEPTRSLRLLVALNVNGGYSPATQ